jgi:hypothetical protein
MKKMLQLLLKEIIIIVICGFLGVAALAVTYLIPRENMRENVIESITALYREELGAHVWESVEETMLDNYTDGLMLNVSYTETDDGLKDILLDTWVEVDGKNPMNSLYETVVLNNENYILKTYGRYWHGHQILLRPLLCFFTYPEIRYLNMILQLILVFFFVYYLTKSDNGANRKFILPFFGLYVFLSPVTLFTSLQYSPCFYIMLLALITLFVFKGRMDDAKRNYLFLLVGILIAYFDLLTYPMITLAVPLIAHLAMDDDCLSSLKKGAKVIASCTASWGIGYVGMWAMKWIIASVLTDENVIANAVNQLMFRSGHFGEKKKFLTTLKLNFSVCDKKILILAFLCLLLFIIGYRIKRRENIDRQILPALAEILFVSLYPFLWYFFTENHSCDNSYFTWRELGISVFGILTLLVTTTRDRVSE